MNVKLILSASQTHLLYFFLNSTKIFKSIVIAGYLSPSNLNFTLSSMGKERIKGMVYEHSFLARLVWDVGFKVIVYFNVSNMHNTIKWVRWI